MWTHQGMGKDMTHTDDRGYVNEGGDDQEQIRAPSVISMNGVVASLALQRLQALALGVAPPLETGAFRYQPRDATLRKRKNGLDELTSCRGPCTETPAVSTGDNVSLDRGEDPSLSKEIDAGSLPTPGELPVDEETDQSVASDAEPTGTLATDERSTWSFSLSRIGSTVRDLISGLL